MIVSQTGRLIEIETAKVRSQNNIIHREFKTMILYYLQLLSKSDAMQLTK